MFLRGSLKKTSFHLVCILSALFFLTVAHCAGANGVSIQAEATLDNLRVVSLNYKHHNKGSGQPGTCPGSIKLYVSNAMAPHVDEATLQAYDPVVGGWSDYRDAQTGKIVTTRPILPNLLNFYPIATQMRLDTKYRIVLRYKKEDVLYSGANEMILRTTPQEPEQPAHQGTNRASREN